jgi:hypothetical protein
MTSGRSCSVPKERSSAEEIKKVFGSLRLKPGMEIHIGYALEPRFAAYYNGRCLLLNEKNIYAALGPISSADQAKDFLRLNHPDYTVIDSEAAYKRVKERCKAKKLGFINGKQPFHFGLNIVHRSKEKDWILTALILDGGFDDDIQEVSYRLTEDGHFGMFSEVYIEGPRGCVQCDRTSDPPDPVTLAWKAFNEFRDTVLDALKEPSAH